VATKPECDTCGGTEIRYTSTGEPYCSICDGVELFL
jgi:hypothetical protein